LADLLVDEGLEAVGQGDVHGTHADRLDGLAKFGKTVPPGAAALAGGLGEAGE
jgi:hypothetical protein